MSNSSQSIDIVKTGIRSAPHAELLKHLSSSFTRAMSIFA